MILLSFLSKDMILELSRFEICWIERKWDFKCDYMFVYMSINIVFEIIRQYPSSRYRDTYMRYRSVIEIQRYRYEIQISYRDTKIQIWDTDQLQRYNDTDMRYRSIIEIQRYNDTYMRYRPLRYRWDTGLWGRLSTHRGFGSCAWMLLSFGD